jgi:CDP-diacylglycerol---serine O-phosphatidyltransferase
MFVKFKDYFTITTILLGFAVLLFSFEHKIIIASALIIAGSIFDLLDGVVARKTNTQNKFGSEFDCIADLVIYSMAPAIMTFFVLYDYNKWYAIIIGSLPLLFGCLRLARFNVKRIEYPGYWIGLIRPASAFLIISFLNTKLATNPLITGIYILLVSVLNVTLIPYIGHHKRKLNLATKIILSIIVIIIIASAFTGYFWEVLLSLSILYLLSPLVIPKEERENIKEFIEEWKKE